MSKSFDFCKARALDISCSHFADRDWSKAIEELETKAVFDEFLHGTRSFFLEVESRRRK